MHIKRTPVLCNGSCRWTPPVGESLLEARSNKSSHCGPFTRQHLPTHTHPPLSNHPVACFLEEVSLRDNKRRIFQVFFCLSSWQLIWYDAHPWCYFQSKHGDEPEIVFTIHFSFVFCVLTLLENSSEIGFSSFLYLQKQLFVSSVLVRVQTLKHFSACGAATIVMSLTRILFFSPTKSESFTRRCVQSLRFVRAKWNITDLKRRPLSFRAKALVTIDLRDVRGNFRALMTH